MCALSNISMSHRTINLDVYMAVSMANIIHSVFAHEIPITLFGTGVLKWNDIMTIFVIGHMITFESMQAFA